MSGLLEKIVEAEGWLEDEPNLSMVEGAAFKKDFGPWKKGDKADILQLTHINGTTLLEEVSEAGNVVRFVEVELCEVRSN